MLTKTEAKSYHSGTLHAPVRGRGGNNFGSDATNTLTLNDRHANSFIDVNSTIYMLQVKHMPMFAGSVSVFCPLSTFVH